MAKYVIYVQGILFFREDMHEHYLKVYVTYPFYANGS